MLTALILICSTTVTPSDCTRDNATTVIRVPAKFGNPAKCFMHGQAYLAETSIGQTLSNDDRVKVVCARADTLPPTRVASPRQGNLGPSSEHGRSGNPRHEARNHSGLRETGAADRTTRSRGSRGVATPRCPLRARLASAFAAVNFLSCQKPHARFGVKFRARTRIRAPPAPCPTPSTPRRGAGVIMGRSK
jgi:hypothetical protein